MSLNWVYQKWWKIGAVVLLLYVTIGSFMIPLGPGITKITPSVFHADSIYTFRIHAYHSHFTNEKAGKLQLWFKHKTNYYAPSSVSVIDAQTLETKFAISSLQQNDFKPSSFDVVVNNDIDGTFALRDALTLSYKTEIDSSGQYIAKQTEPEVVSNKHNLICFPYREILYETIRNTFFHVPMWFVMTMLVFASFLGSVFYLSKQDSNMDILAHQSAVVAMLFGACGYFTGLIWAKYTWYIGVSWGDVLRKLLLEDIKMAAALVAIFFYVAYLVIRGSIENIKRKRTISAVFNIFSFVVFILCVFVLPRLTDSMHPGNGGNPAFSKYDLDSTLRLFFYPAVIGWILLGFWILSLNIRIELLKKANHDA